MTRRKNPDLCNPTPSAIMVYGATWCPDCKRAKQFFGEQRVQYSSIDIDEEPESVSFMEKVTAGKRIIPRSSFLTETSWWNRPTRRLPKSSNLKIQTERSHKNTIVIGNGPAGFTSALYLGRDGLVCWSLRRLPWADKSASPRRSIISQALTRVS